MAQDKRLTITEAAEIMGVTPMFLRLALREGRFSFGTAVKMERWVYYINSSRFYKFMSGGDEKNERNPKAIRGD